MIYVIRSNIFTENVYKIGYSTQSQSELLRRYQTSLGNPEIVLKYKTNNYRKMEKKIHSALGEYRLYPNRELFKCDIDIIKKHISKCKNKYNYINPISIINGYGFIEFINKWDGETVDNSKEWFIELKRIMGFSLYDMKFFFKRENSNEPLISDNIDMLGYYFLNIGPKRVSFRECLMTRHKVSLITYPTIIKSSEKTNSDFDFLFSLSDKKYKISEIYDLYNDFCDKNNMTKTSKQKISTFMGEMYTKSKLTENGKSHTIYDILKKSTNDKYKEIYGIDYVT